MHDYYKSDLRDYVTELLVYDFELDTLIVNLKQFQLGIVRNMFALRGKTQKLYYVNMREEIEQCLEN